MTIPKPLTTLERILRKEYPDSRVYLVGGAVRDRIMKRESKDLDAVVSGVPPDALEKILEREGEARLVGKSFGVYKWNPGHNMDTIDIALPRSETGWGTGGRRDVTVQSDHMLSIEEDLKRRDFTINAIAYDVRAKRYIDPKNGRTDIKNKIIKTVGDPSARFAEDYSRILRALRFATELNFSIEKNTWRVLRKRIGLVKKVTKEIAAEELGKSLSNSPSRALLMFYKAGLLPVLLPELIPMLTCRQPKKWHSEGNVWEHTIIALKTLETIKKPPFDPTLVIAVILHDSGKPATRKTRGNKVTFYNHANVAVRLARKIIKRLKLDSAGVNKEHVAWLVKHHMILFTGDPLRLRNTTVERYFLSERYPSDHLITLIECDSRSSVPKNPKRDNMRGLNIVRKRIAEIKKKPPKALLNGDEIMNLLELKPGPEVGKALLRLREAQLDGRIAGSAEAREFLRRLSAKPKKRRGRDPETQHI